MTTDLESAIVRLRAADGPIVGVGFLVTDWHILTCAHVVADVLNLLHDNPDPPQAHLTLDFPLLAPDKVLTARVVHWQPTVDIAGLELVSNRPAEAKPLRLVDAEDWWEHPFRAFGFPKGFDDGVWASGVLRGRQANGWVQIEDVKQTGYFVQLGFSGSPVWDDEFDGVAGMTVATDASEGVRAAFIIPTDVLIETWPTLGERTIPPCPYRGLFAFREQDAPFFFGREDFTDRLVRAVQQQSLVAVIIGPSGTGKSSVVFAGLLPRLRQEMTYIITDFRPSGRPFYALAASLVSLLEPNMSETDRLLETRKMAEALSQGDLSVYDVVARILQKRPEANHLLLIADQFEELYTLCSEIGIRQRFLDRVLEAVQSQGDQQHPVLTVALTLRADFLGLAMEHRPFADALDGACLHLGPMTRQELERAIKKPAESLGVEFEHGLAERILDDIGNQPGNLPLLEFTLEQLWKRQENGWLTHTAYEAIGQVAGALAHYAEEKYDELIRSGAKEEQLRHIFVQLVRPGEGTEDTRRLATRTEVGQENWELVTRLATERLVVTSRDETIGEKGEETVEFAHEALIWGWERVQDWMKTDRSFRAWQERLRASLHQWHASGRDEGALLRGAPLAEAEGWLYERGTDLSQTEREFIRASTALHECERATRERLRRRIMLGLSIGLMVSLTLALLAALLWQRAEEQRDAAKHLARIALSRELAAAATNKLDVDPELGLLLAAEAMETQYSVQAEDALRQALASPWRVPLRGHTDWVNSAAYSPDGRWIVTASEDNTTRVWDAKTGQQKMLLRGHTASVRSAAYSPDGRWIVTASKDNTVRVWDGQNGQQRMELKHTSPVNWAIYSPDGQWIVTAEDRTARVWDAESGQQKMLLGEHSYSVNSVAYSPDGRWIITAAGSTARVWDAENGLQKMVLEGHTDFISSVAYSPDGQWIVTAGDRTARVWDAESGEQKMALEGEARRVWSAAYSPDGRWIVTASEDNTAQIWDARNGQQKMLLQGHTASVRSAAYSPDGRWIVTASRDRTAQVWSAEGGQQEIVLEHESPVESVAYSPEGRWIATATRRGTVQMWDAESWQRKAVLRGHSSPVLSVAYNPDGQSMVTASEDNTARIWDVKSRRQKVVLEGHTDFVNSAVYSPDGRWIVTASPDGTARVWSAESGQQKMVLEGHTSFVSSAAYSPDGRWIVTVGGDRMARVWDAESGQQKMSLEGHLDFVQSVSYSPDGRWIATTSGDRTARVWDAESGQQKMVLQGHTDHVSSVAYSPDGRWIVTGSDDGTARIWDAESGEQRIVLHGHTEYISSVTYSPDGQMVVTSSGDGTTRVWRWAKVDDLLADAKSRATRELSCQERVQYLHEDLVCSASE
jgi:WD40 repeat protein